MATDSHTAEGHFRKGRRTPEVLQKEEKEMFNVVFSICSLIAVSAMFLSHIFYTNVPTTCMFWICLGYLIMLIEKNKNDINA